MKINVLITSIGTLSGGAIYDKNFFEILKSVHDNVVIYDDDYFKQKYGKESIRLLEFNKIYKENIEQIFDCDYLVMNSRIYTRFLMVNIKKIADRFKDVQLIIIHHHNNYMNNKGVAKVVHKHYELALLKAASELVIPNQYVIDNLSKVNGMSSIKCLPSSFDKTQYPISELNNKVMLFVGTVEPRKGIDYGLKAFNVLYKKHREYKYIIAGRTDADVKYYERLMKYVEDNDLKDAVIFEGRVSDERLQELYVNADIFLFPSLLEGYGWVMIEAMGRGLPVVAFDNSAMPYTVEDGVNGRLIPNKHWEKMGNILIEIVENGDELNKLQKGALETFWSVPLKEDLDSMTLEYIKDWK